ncbi:MAG: hypothetical protein ACJ790_02520 [Myxococcaceae bacterium]
MLNAFHEGGWGMFPTLICGALTIVMALRYSLAPAKRLVPLLVSLNVMTLLAGSLGFVTGLIVSTTAISATTPMQPELALIGFGESLNNVALALVLMMFAAIATTIGSFGRAESEAA